MTITTPQTPQFEATGENAGRFTIAGCYPGYGTTIGNALRRVLLSSLGGAAITSVKITGVSHEFSTIEGVMEDVVQIILNLKRVRVRSLVDAPITMTLTAKGDGPVTAGQISTPSGVEIVNPDHVIATITDKKVVLEMELEVRTGIGYLPVEQQEREEKEIGVIAIDAIFTPIRRVNYLVENMRVGKRTDYDKVTIDIVTDGSVTPQDAFHQGVAILMGQFTALAGVSQNESVAQEASLSETVSIASGDLLSLPISELSGLSTRTVNVLTSAKIMTIGDVAKRSIDELNALDGMGEKGIAEITTACTALGIVLGA